MSFQHWEVGCTRPLRALSPQRPLRRLSSRLTIRPCLPQWTFNAVGEFELNRKKPSTVDCTLRPSPTEPCLSLPPAKEEFKHGLLETRRRGLPMLASNDAWKVWLWKLQQRSQSTFIAVGGLDCKRKLTEQWMQLWPRFPSRKVAPEININWQSWIYSFARLSEFVCGSSWQRRKWTENTMSKAPLRLMNVSFV